MAKIGSLGDIVFSVSKKTIMTITNFKYDTSAKYSTHERHLKSPLLEFTGTGVENITFDISLNAFLGVSPMKQFEKIKSAEANGKIMRLIIGKKTIGNYKWVITKAAMSDTRIDKSGNLLCAKVSLTLNSYEKR